MESAQTITQTDKGLNKNEVEEDRRNRIKLLQLKYKNEHLAQTKMQLEMILQREPDYVEKKVRAAAVDAGTKVQAVITEIQNRQAPQKQNPDNRPDGKSSAPAAAAASVVLRPNMKKTFIKNQINILEQQIGIVRQEISRLENNLQSDYIRYAMHRQQGNLY